MLYPVELRGRERALRNGSRSPNKRVRMNRGMNLGTLDRKPVKVAGMSPVEEDEQDLTRKQRREQAEQFQEVHTAVRGDVVKSFA